MKLTRLSLVFALTTAVGLSVCVPAAAQMSPPPMQSQAGPPAAPPEQLTPEQLQQLLAPIALYPDSLVAQILAAATYPAQIVEAERFLEQNQGLQGEALANAVNAQPWDPSVKALTAFLQVLSDMNQNLSWTSELGDANYNQPEDVMNAIQALREQAQQAGTLQSNSQQTVDDVNGSIAIEPSNPDEVYVPDYDPGYVYGQPVGMWPGFYPWWTAGGPYISFGFGVPVRPWYGYGWGWHHWRMGWGRHPGIWYGQDRWRSERHEYYDHGDFDRGEYRGYGGHGIERGGFYGGRGEYEGHGGAYTTPRPGMHSGYPGDYHVGNGGSARGYGQPSPGMRSGAAGGVMYGGEGRGRSGMGGGFHGGGGSHGAGGSHGGGGFQGGRGGQDGGHR